jgi:hypothetical protein
MGHDPSYLFNKKKERMDGGARAELIGSALFHYTDLYRYLSFFLGKRKGERPSSREIRACSVNDLLKKEPVFWIQ